MEAVYRALVKAFRPVVDDSAMLVTCVSVFSSIVGVNFNLVNRIIEKESQWDPSAVSPTGAIGLGQITGPALADFNATFDLALKREDMYDSLWNALVTVWYIGHVARLAGHDPMTSDTLAWAETYAAYNVGYGSLLKLRDGNYDASLRKLVGYQASALSAGGPERYLDNVRAFLSTEVA